MTYVVLVYTAVLMQCTCVYCLSTAYCDNHHAVAEMFTEETGHQCNVINVQILSQQEWHF